MLADEKGSIEGLFQHPRLFRQRVNSLVLTNRPGVRVGLTLGQPWIVPRHLRAEDASSGLSSPALPKRKEGSMRRSVFVLLALTLLVESSPVRAEAQTLAPTPSQSDHITSEGPESSLRDQTRVPAVVGVTSRFHSSWLSAVLRLDSG
jgi:hypothetical protein